ncbi:hypothetical protein V6N13_106381 [Hibiscus sabdariffa]|uniref:S-locus glycoprotein domain-containing protein n=1 Tax=Hibiscus sabdariffa TaxID=183260 RepID=A0ABR2F0H9_9ROSI
MGRFHRCRCGKVSITRHTHGFLVVIKLSLNKRTNETQFLTSWENEMRPLELDPSGTNQYFILRNKTENYWTSGPWDEQARIFSLVPEMRLNYIYNFNYASNENESYFTYSLYNPSTISRFVMDVSGQIKQLSWLESNKQWNLFWSQPRQQCQVSSWSLKDYSGGCERKTKLQCQDLSLSNGKSDEFLECPNMLSLSVSLGEFRITNQPALEIAPALLMLTTMMGVKFGLETSWICNIVK